MCALGCVYEHSCVGVDTAHQSAIHDPFGWNLSNQMINTTISFFICLTDFPWEERHVWFQTDAICVTVTETCTSWQEVCISYLNLILKKWHHPSHAWNQAVYDIFTNGPCMFIKETLVGFLRWWISILSVRWQNTTSIIHLLHKWNGTSEGRSG